MRTTVTLDLDVAAKIKAEMKRSGKTFKEALNALLRGAPMPGKLPVDEPFRVLARPLGERPGLNYNNIGELLEQLEGPEYK